MESLDVSPFSYAGGSTGCLLIHGFSGSPPEMRPMGEYLAQQGLTVLGPRLAGHGTTPEDMAQTGWSDWVASAEEALAELKGHCDQVFIAGLSMGGLITLHLAAHHDVAGIVAMSTPAYISDWRFRFLPLAQPFVRWFTPNMDWDTTDPLAPQRCWCYSRLPTSCIVSLGELMRLVRRELPRVLASALIMHGRHDRSVPADSPQIFFDGLGTQDKEIVWWANSGHSITVDSEREAVWARAYAFMVAHG
jgi:carboxylesterase